MQNDDHSPAQKALQSAGEAPTAQNQLGADHSLLPTVHSSLLAAHTKVEGALVEIANAIAAAECAQGKLAAFDELLAACKMFTAAAHEARDALNNRAIACPASIAFAAEKARAAIAKAEGRT